MHARTATTAAGLLAAGLLLSACSSSSGDGKAAGEHGSASAAATKAATPAADASTTAAAPSAPATQAIGRPWHWSDPGGYVGSITVISYKQPVLRSDPPDTSLGVPVGSQWGRLDIRVCLTAGQPINVSQEPWHMQFSDGSQADNTGLNGGDFPKPEYPQGRDVAAGECARGGIMFPIPKGQRPVKVAYSPDSSSGPVYWTVPKK
jgi:hypothetical protein